MAEKKKSIMDEAILDAKKIQETLNANTKEILRSIAKEEIDDLVKESLNEFEEEDVEDMEVDTDDVDVDAVDADAELPVDTDEPIDSIGDESGEEITNSEEGGLEDYETGMGAEEVPSGDEMDMTTASDDDVIAVYKKLTGDDEIQIVSNEAGDIELTVNEPGEFVIKANANAGEVESSEIESDGMEMGDMETGEMEAGEMEAGEMETELPMDDIAMAGDSEEEEEEETYESYDMNESQVVFEIAIDEMEDIESVSAPVGNENDDNWAGDNLEGGFDDEGQNGTGDSHGEHIMEDETVTETEEISEEEVVEGEEAVEETKYVGGKVKRVATAHTNQKLANESTEFVSKADYDKLLSEAKAFKKKSGEMARTLQEQRKLLKNVVVFNTNLTNVTRLFTEHSTTKDEKKTIIGRFDEGVSNIEESKRLYKTIEKELGNKSPISESVESNSTGTSSSTSQLNESTAYADQGTKRIIDLMSRVDNKDKF